MQDLKKGTIAPAKILFGLMFLSCLTALPMESRGEESGGNPNQGVQVIEYDQLRELLKAGNLSLKKEYQNYEETIADYQEMWDIMKREQGNLEDKAEKAEESGDEDFSLYSSNAMSLKGSASRIYKQIEGLTDTKSERQLEKAADSSLLAAQTLMNSCRQMELNVEARLKSVEAQRAAYNGTVRRQEAGTATAADVTSAGNELDQAENSLAALQEQAASLRRQLLIMVGMPLDSQAAMGAIPEPDLGAIDSIDFETDKARAINNSSRVISTRHKSASGTGAWKLRAKAVDEAEGTAEASITAAYQDLLSRRTQYQAALSASESARLTYESLQRRKAAGMLDNTDYLRGEADYLEAMAAGKTASMNLVQAYESYCWEVKGVE